MSARLNHRAGMSPPIARPYPDRAARPRAGVLFPDRGGRRLTLPACERPGRDHRRLGPSAGSSLLLRAPPVLPSPADRACPSVSPLKQGAC
jgi:hypothetical protein